MNKCLAHAGTAAVVSLAVTLSTGSSSYAADIKVLSSSGVRGTVSELGRQFEAGTGNKLVADYNVFAVLIRRIDAGEPFDVTILSPALIDTLIKRGKIAADTRTPFGRAGIAVAVRKGAPKPDIGTVEAFRRAMLNAKSIAYGKEGTSGKIFLAALDRLGIADAMKPKLMGYEGASTPGAVAKGETELAVTGFGPILAEPGAELVGGLPGELQSYVVFTIGVNAQTKQPEAARALVRYLTAPAALPLMKANGLEPGG